MTEEEQYQQLEPSQLVEPLKNVTILTLPKSFVTLKPTPICNMILKSDKCSKFYTGLTKNQRVCLWNFLGESKDKLTMIGMKKGTLSGKIGFMSVECQFLMTLLILRRDRLFQDISFQFDLLHYIQTSKKCFHGLLCFMINFYY